MARQWISALHTVAFKAHDLGEEHEARVSNKRVVEDQTAQGISSLALRQVILAIRDFPASAMRARSHCCEGAGWVIPVYVMEDAMDPKGSCSTSSANVFTEAEYRADAGRVIAHAAAEGRAIVVRADGTPRVVISIPPADAPKPERIG